MTKRNLTYYAKWTLFAFIAIGVCVMAGCQAMGEFFAHGPDGGLSRADEIAAGIGAVAPMFGPYGIIGTGVASAVAGLGGMWARNRGKKLKKGVPALSGVVKGLERWKRDNPTAWEELGGIIGDIIDDDDRDVVDHFRQGKRNDSDLKGIKGA